VSYFKKNSFFWLPAAAMAGLALTSLVVAWTSMDRTPARPAPVAAINTQS
jgi:hypothetical protein